MNNTALKDIATELDACNRQYYDLEGTMRIKVNEMLKLAEPLSEGEFWLGIPLLAKQIENRRRLCGQEAYKGGIHNFFCEGRDNCLKVLRFVKTYQQMVSKVHNNDDCYDGVKDYDYYSDDGWHDFCDYLPLRGKAVYNKVLSGKVSAKYHKEHLSDHHEAYIVSNMEERLQMWGDNIVRALTVLEQPQKEEEYDFFAM